MLVRRKTANFSKYKTKLKRVNYTQLIRFLKDILFSTKMLKNLHKYFVYHNYDDAISFG